MRRSKKRKSAPRGAITALALALCLLAGLLALRVFGGEESAAPAQPMISADSAAEPFPASESSLPEPTALRTEETPAPRITAEPSPEQAPAATPYAAPKGYTARTYQLVSEMVYIRRYETPDGDEQIRALEQELTEADPALGAAWSGIMDYWRYANLEMPINRSLPDHLPQDDSLCLVVLGYQLLYDGDMAPELLGRCELALACARQYPNAFIAVTGGGTAAGDKSVTEASVMAEYFLAQGIAPERIIREETSLTTDQNATNTCAIFVKKYPQIKQVAVISSDYHVPLGCTMFTEAALLSGYERGEVPYTVVANAGYVTSGSSGAYNGMKNQASYVWIMADPKY